MSHGGIRVALVVALLAFPSVVSARGPQSSSDAVSAGQTAVQNATAQAAAAQAAYAQAAASQAAAARQAAAQAAAARQASAHQTAVQAAAARQAAAHQAAAKSALARQTAAMQKTAPQTASATAAKTTATKSTGANANSSPSSSVTTLLTSLLANGNTNPASANSKSGTPSKAGAPANGAVPASAMLPANKEVSGAGAAPATPDASRKTVGGKTLPAGALGMAEANNSILTVYGCSRQGTQVLCDTDLSNQDKSGAQLDSSTAWSDAYIIDDRGDRHQRTIGFFLNIDGYKRVNLDIPYGQSVRYVFVFNDVQEKVSKVALHSVAGGLDVESIPVADPNAGPTSASTAETAANKPSDQEKPAGNGRPPLPK